MMKEYLFIANNVEELTYATNSLKIDSDNIRLCLSRSRGQIKYAVLVHGKFVHTEYFDCAYLQEAQYIWISSFNGLRDRFLQDYTSQIDSKIIDILPKDSAVGEKYFNPNGLNFLIYPKMDGRIRKEWRKNCDLLQQEIKDYAIEGRELPFIYEPRLERINKAQTQSYTIYTLGRKDFDAGLYFDNKQIEAIKAYSNYNASVYVLVYGSCSDEYFVRDSIYLYEYIYGKDHVIVREKIQSADLEDEKEYLIVSAGLRMISPYICKFFKKYTKSKDRIGIISPDRHRPQISEMMFGKGILIKDFLASVNSLDAESWYNYIMEKTVVAEWEMFNVMRYGCLSVNCKEKENKIGFVEWLRGYCKMRESILCN